MTCILFVETKLFFTCMEPLENTMRISCTARILTPLCSVNGTHQTKCVLCNVEEWGLLHLFLCRTYHYMHNAFEHAENVAVSPLKGGLNGLINLPARQNPPHWYFEVRFLNEQMLGSWIRQRGSIPWPRCSPDLTTMDSFIWGQVKNYTYTAPMWQSMKSYKAATRVDAPVLQSGVSALPLVCNSWCTCWTPVVETWSVSPHVPRQFTLVVVSVLV